MVIGHFFFSIFLFFSPLQTESDNASQVIENLNPQLKFFDGNSWNGKVNKDARAAHLSLDLSQTRGSYLLIESKHPFYVFINSTFACKGNRHLVLRSDSLRKEFSNTIFLSIYQKDGVGDLSLKWVSRNQPDEFYNPKRPALTFSNFLLITSLILILFFTALFRTNPQLTLDYLNVIKLFYLRDREENQITLRITSSVNLLFYLFCSLLAALAMIIATHFSTNSLTPFEQSIGLTTGQYMGQWILLALAILGLLMAKLAFASLFGLMYGWDIASFQFFNFVRVLILSLTLIAAISVFCFSFQIDINYFILLRFGCLLMGIGAVLLYFKLQTRTSFHSFHLFSYLCATEIFPLVILVKVLLF